MRMLGYSSAEEIMAVDIAGDIYVDAEQRAAVLRAYSGAGPLEVNELKWKRKDGRQITVRLSGSGPA